MSPSAAKGQHRRAELVRAGVALLAEDGWGGLTHRAVGARANANAGLVHYYFNGTRGLRLAVAAEASGRSIGAIFDHVLAAEDEAQLVANIAQMLASARDDAEAGRLTAELVSAAFADQEIGDLVRREFAQGRVRLEHWLVARHPSWPAGRARATAAVITATIDGLGLHLLLDPELRVGDIEVVLRQLGAYLLMEPNNANKEQSRP